MIMRTTSGQRRAAAVASAGLLFTLKPLCESFVICRKVVAPSACHSFRYHQPRRPNDSRSGFDEDAGPVLLRASASPNSERDDIDNDEDEDNVDVEKEEDVVLPRFSEQSQMLGFISDYLRKEEENADLSNIGASDAVATEASCIDEISSIVTSSDESDPVGIVASDDDYLIAIPLDNCHELGLELESVQRAILYHCPVLVHACIPMAATRLPLLYLTAVPPESPTQRVSASTSAALQSVVRRAVRRVLFEEPSSVEQEMDDGSVAGVKRDDGRPDVEGANADGIRPVLIPFSTLEIDGTNNQVLFTVGDVASSGGKALTRLVTELRKDIESNLPGWTVRLPNDPSSSSNSQRLRLRVPFVRLPPNWDEYLDPSKDYHTSDEGGNGISPILWGQWMDDDFGDAVRMREVAIYPRKKRPGRMGTDGKVPPLSQPMTEEAIYHVPDFVVALPEGNAELAKVEKKFATYQDQRIREAEARERKGTAQEEANVGDGDLAMKGGAESTGPTDDMPVPNTPLDKYDALFTRTLDRLESLYADDAGDANGTESEPTKESADAVSPSQSAESDEVVTPTSFRETVDSAVASLDTRPVEVAASKEASDESQDRMRRVVESRARIETERDLLAKRKQDKPPIEENPVFAKYKDGTLVPQSSSASRKFLVGETASQRTLPPFPSNEHVVGFWRVVRSPTGFDVEEGDSSRSDNLVLRVDGTTAGGPILNKDTRQKASAGTWRLLASKEDADGGTDDNDNRPKSADLRIRLVIPPQKERILVMQGKLERVSMSGSDLPLAPRGTFGIPALEERAARGSSLEQDTEDLVYCSGTVYLEDAVTGNNRDEIGTFTLQKLFTPTDPAQYTITIPRPVRNQD